MSTGFSIGKIIWWFPLAFSPCGVQGKLKFLLSFGCILSLRYYFVHAHINPIQTGGRGEGSFRTPPFGKIVITFTPKELWRSNFLTFPKIYLGTFWYNYHVHAINHVAMATSFWHIGFGKCKKMVNFLFYDRVFTLIVLFVYNIEYLGGRGGLKFVTFLLWQICCFIFQITLPESFVWVINISLILLLYIMSFSPLKVALNFNFLKKRKSKMADPRWRTTILNFRSLLLSIAFSRGTSVSLLLVHKKG